MTGDDAAKPKSTGKPIDRRALLAGGTPLATVSFEFGDGAPAMRLAANGNDLAYDATDKFRPAQMFTFMPATESTLGGR